MSDDPLFDARAEPVPATSAGASATRTLVVAGLTVTGAVLLSRVLGYVRYVAIAAAVPDPAQLDAFFAAFRIPDLLFQLVAAGALSSALIPVVAGLFATDQAARAWRVVSSVATLMLTVLAILVVVAFLLAPQLVALITPGFDERELALTTELTRIMLVSPLLLAAGAVAISALNARDRFGAAAMAPLAYNVGIIAGALLLVPPFGVAGLAMGVVLGAAGHVTVQLPALRAIGARIRPRADLGDAQARRALALMGPRAIGLGATQIVFVVMTSLASGLPTGSIAVFNFAFAMLQIPIGVIGVPLGVVLLPSLSREAALGAGEGFRRLLVGGLGLLAFVMIGIAAVGIVVSEDAVRLLFGFTGVSEEAIQATAVTLSVFLVGLTAHSLIAVLARSFYALQDTATPVTAALLAVVVNVVVATALVGPLGLTGLAVAMAGAAWLELLTLVVLLRRRVPGLALGRVGMVMAKALVAGIAGALVAWATTAGLTGAWGSDPGFLLVLVRGCAAAVAGLAVYLGVSLTLRIEEPRRIVGIMADLLRRRGRT